MQCCQVWLKISALWLHSGYMEIPMPRPKSTLAVDLSKPCELTSGLIDRLRCPAGTQQVFLRDSKSPGLRVRATSGGSKSFVFEAKLRRQTVRRTIGDVRAWSIEAARSEANRLRVALDMGNDPRVADREERERHRVLSEDEARRATTFAQAWDCYLEARKAVWRGRTHFDHTAMVAAGGRPERRGTRGRASAAW